MCCIVLQCVAVRRCTDSWPPVSASLVSQFVTVCLPCKKGVMDTKLSKTDLILSLVLFLCPSPFVSVSLSISPNRSVSSHTQTQRSLSAPPHPHNLFLSFSIFPVFGEFLRPLEIHTVCANVHKSRPTTTSRLTIYVTTSRLLICAGPCHSPQI